MSKVNFDTENIGADDCYSTPKVKSLVGLRTLENGLTFIGIYAGGDWETPLFFILYNDGKKLRGYIPEEGNPWNTDTKQAYGNNEEKDRKNMIKQNYNPDGEIDFDFLKIEKDISERIQYKEK